MCLWYSNVPPQYIFYIFCRWHFTDSEAWLTVRQDPTWTVCRCYWMPRLHQVFWNHSDARRDCRCVWRQTWCWLDSFLAAWVTSVLWTIWRTLECSDRKSLWEYCLLSRSVHPEPINIYMSALIQTRWFKTNCCKMSKAKYKKEHLPEWLLKQLLCPDFQTSCC